MSIFKEKDDLFTSIFKDDSDESDNSDTRDNNVSKSVTSQKVSLSGKLEHEEDANNLSDKKRQKVDTPDISLVSEIKLDSTNSTLEESSKELRPKEPEIVVFSDQNELVTIDDDDTVIYSNDVIEISSSDDEQPAPSNEIIDSTPDLEPTPSKDTSQREINLKLTIGGKYYQYESNYHQTFATTFKPLIDDLKRQNKCLILTVDDKQISLEDNPQTVNLHAGSIITGFDVANRNESPVAQPRSSNQVLLKVQDGNRKHTREYLVHKTEAMSKLKQLYGKDIGVEDLSHIRLCFDGDIVDDDQTPEELDMEDDCVVDAIICSSSSG